MQIYTYRISVPPSDADIVSRELSVFIGTKNDPRQIMDFEEGLELSFNAGEQVRLVLVDIDEFDDRAEPIEFFFTATDAVTPPASGEFGVTLIPEDEQE